ncbi:inositol phosphorylceramide synthase [Nocardioides daphniae]|uniref:Inositol phosphorylceramide synthase n=2 Tax=Nocardioides daphniae TaxID=402297 RepID=A0A4P7UDF7_9ACTN|nr:inositol phosphorylceramide synthase [Nocardioides daphniae]
MDTMARVYRRAYVVLIGTTALMGIIALVMSVALDRKFVDPEGFLGPSWLRLPLLVLAALLADMLPQYFWVGRGRPSTGWAAVKNRWRLHWTKARWILVVLGIACFYVTYVSYRNIKSYLPFVMGETKYDRELHVLDRAMFFGNEPATVLHNLLGTGFSAHFLSTIYVGFLPLVAIMVAVYVVWSRNLRFGYWFVTSQVLIWTLGTAMYYCLPSLGPGFRYHWLFTDLPNTGTSDLMDSLFYGRKTVLHDGDPRKVQSVAAFASLHTGVTLLWALMIQYTLRNRVVKALAWSNFGVTIIATLYFGWHYVADDIAGIAIALVSFAVGGWAAGQKFSKKALREALDEVSDVEPSEPEPVPASKT